MKVLAPADRSAGRLAALEFVATRARLFGPQTAVHLLSVQLPIPPRAARAAGREMVRGCHRAEAETVLYAGAAAAARRRTSGQVAARRSAAPAR